MNHIVPYSFDGHRVRTHIDEEGCPWFAAKDVCGILGYSKYRDAVAKLDGDEARRVKMDTLGGKQDLVAVNEVGLYLLVFRSNKPEAKKFSTWVAKVVLPEIRRTGSFNAGPSWSDARAQGKTIRKIATDVMAVFVEYAKSEGSQSADKYYMNFSRMVNDALLEIEGKKPANLRDQLNVAQLMQIGVAEGIIAKSITECIARRLPYKDVYQVAKRNIAAYATTVGRSRLGATEKQTLGLSGAA